MFVIGIDSHKDTLAACLVDHLGTPLEYRNISNTPAGHRQLVDWAQTQNAARMAIEGSGTYGRPLGVAAVTAGLDVREVPPQLTAQARRRGRTQTKTDQVDALVIARIALRDHTLAAPTYWEDTEDLRVLVTYRRELVEDRTAQANPAPRRPRQAPTRLPPQHSPVHHPKEPRPSHETAMARHHHPEPGSPNNASEGCGNSTPRSNNSPQRIEELVNQTRTRLRDIHGVGVLVAATIIAEVGNPHRYPTKDKFAMANGTAPLRNQFRASGETPTQPRREPPNQPGHPHRRSHPDRPPRHRRTPLLPKTHHPRENPQRSNPRPQTTNLRPHLDPPPTPENSPQFDIGAHTLTQTI